MKALCCFLLLCGVYISSNHAFGIRFGIRKAQVPEEAKQQTSSETPNTDESKSSSDFASINRGLLKKTEEKISQLEKSLTSYLKPNAEESNLLEVPELINKTSKQLKVFGNKIIRTEEKIVSTGTKDNGTIAIYKIIHMNTLTSNSQESKSASSDDEKSEQGSDKSDKSSGTAEKKDEPSENQKSEKDEQSAQTESPTPAKAQSPQNESNFEIVNSDGVPKHIRGIVIRVAPKSDGSKGKQFAFQFLKK